MQHETFANAVSVRSALHAPRRVHEYKRVTFDEIVQKTIDDRCNSVSLHESRTFGTVPILIHSEHNNTMDSDMMRLIGHYNNPDLTDWSRTGVFGVDVTGKLKKAGSAIKSEVKKVGGRYGIGSGVDEDPFTTLSKEFVRIALESSKTLQHLQALKSVLQGKPYKSILKRLYTLLYEDSLTMKNLGLLNSDATGHLDASPDRLGEGIRRIITKFKIVDDAAALDDFVDRYLNAVSHHIFGNLSSESLDRLLVAYKDVFEINI